MMVLLSLFILVGLVSGGIGAFIAVLVIGRQKDVPRNDSQPVEGKAIAASHINVQLTELIRSFSELVSQVDSQVGSHLSQVGAVTESLSAAATPEVLMSAANVLIATNQKLQQDLTEAKSELQRQRSEADIYFMESRTDALTNLANRRAFDLEIERVIVARGKNPVSLLAIDIDHFKRINDRYGHMVGDQLLKAFSRCLESTLKETGFVARYGGEEFAAILSKTSLDEAVKLAELVRSSIAQMPFKVGEIVIQMTASFGVKEIGPGESGSEWIVQTDRALMAAKKGGRNRIFLHDGVDCVPYLGVVSEEEELANDSDGQLADDHLTASAIEPLSMDCETHALVTH